MTIERKINISYFLGTQILYCLKAWCEKVFWVQDTIKNLEEILEKEEKKMNGKDLYCAGLELGIKIGKELSKE